MSGKQSKHVWTFALALVLTLAAGLSLARAHAVLEQKEAKTGAGYKAVVKIGHGCDGSATTRVSVEIPEGVIGVKPMPKPGWTIKTERAAYARSYRHYHGDLSEGVRRITWEGGPLADDHYDEFVFASFIAREIPGDRTIYFPVTQTCEKGELAWTQIPAAGQDPHALEAPAASLKLVQAAPRAYVAGKPGAEVHVAVFELWSRATPAGSNVAAGYLKIANKGTAADRLTGGSFERVGKVEIHTMIDDGGIMKMRPLETGLEIRPGETVELKPGGLHLMLMGLSAGFKEGEAIKGSLTFEKAGSIDVVLTVKPLGAPSSGGSHAGHDH